MEKKENSHLPILGISLPGKLKPEHPHPANILRVHPFFDITSPGNFPSRELSPTPGEEKSLAGSPF